MDSRYDGLQKIIDEALSAMVVEGTVSRIACFAMVCHHCTTLYIEFFPSVRQENLFLGMLHSFMELGISDGVLTDNMK